MTTGTALSRQGSRVTCGGIDTHYHDVGSGLPVVLLHGSGPGVTARSNWERTIEALSGDFRTIAPEMVGYGATERPPGIAYGVSTWMRHVLDFLDALSLETVDIVGNSMGALVALHIAQAHPDRIRRLVLMGAPAPGMQPTEGLRALRAYEPSLENMRRLIADHFLFDRAALTEDLVQARYEASRDPQVHEAYRSMFHDPKHAGNDLNLTADGVRSIAARTLIVHGREDKVIPPDCALELFSLISGSDVGILSRSGHWPQIERSADFARLVTGFLQSR